MIVKTKIEMDLDQTGPIRNLYAVQEDTKTRMRGTATEQSFDIFTVNRKTRTIYATKIGAGRDRVISYKFRAGGIGRCLRIFLCTLPEKGLAFGSRVRWRWFLCLQPHG